MWPLTKGKWGGEKEPIVGGIHETRIRGTKFTIDAYGRDKNLQLLQWPIVTMFSLSFLYFKFYFFLLSSWKPLILLFGDMLNVRDVIFIYVSLGTEVYNLKDGGVNFKDIESWRDSNSKERYRPDSNGRPGKDRPGPNENPPDPTRTIFIVFLLTVHRLPICFLFMQYLCASSWSIRLWYQCFQLPPRCSVAPMTVSDDENESLAYFLESEVLSEVSDQVRNLLD